MTLKLPPNPTVVSLASDFHQENLIREIDDHSKEIRSLDKRIIVIEEKFGTNEKVADLFSAIADRDIKIQDLFSKTFIRLLNNNEDIKKKISDIVNETDRAFNALMLKRIGITGGGIILAVISAIAGAFATNYIKPH